MPGNTRLSRASSQRTQASRHRRVVLTAAMLASMPLHGAFAAPAGEDPPAAQVTSGIQETVITAQHREENLQETPISVTAFTGEAIGALGFRQSVDIAAQTPNFSVGYPVGDTAMPAAFIRGVGLGDFGVLNQSPVASYTDDTYVAASTLSIFQLLDMQRVEVLRGPQGTLYGRNATGGAVNYISVKPTQTWDGWLHSSYSSFDKKELTGAFGGPIDDDTAFRVAFLRGKSDGWMKNRLTGHTVQGIDEFAWRVLLDHQFTDDISVLVNVHGGHTGAETYQYRHQGAWDEAGNTCSVSDTRANRCVDIFGYSEYRAYTTLDGRSVPATPDYDEGNYDLEGHNDTDFYGGSVTLDWSLGDYYVKSVSSFDKVHDLRPEDADASPNDILTTLFYGVRQRSLQQELRVGFNSEQLNWTAGAYFLKDKGKEITQFEFLGDLRPDFIGNNTDCGPRPIAGNPTGFCPDQFVFRRSAATLQEIDSFAVFADGSYWLNDKLQLTAGIRYTDESVSHDALYRYIETVPVNDDILPGFPDSENLGFDNISGRVLANYHIDDDQMVYASISQGFKAGGIQTQPDGISPYDEEKLLSYELGYKSTWLEGRLRFNAAAFFYDYADLQVYAFTIVDGQSFQQISNASDAQNYGAEFEVQWLPIDDLAINLGAGLLRTEYQDFLLPDPTDTSQLTDYSGNSIPMSPELTFNGLITYDVHLPDGSDVTLQTDFKYQDKVFFDSFNNPLMTQESYWMWNARAAWKSASGNWEAAAWVRNLADKEYLTYKFDLTFFGLYEEMLGSPRSFGAEVTYRM